MDTTEAFKSLLEDAIEETGADLQASVQEVAAYMAERTAVLQAASAEPGFAQAVRAERNNVAMRAGLNAAADAEAADARILGVVQGALSIAALALA